MIRLALALMALSFAVSVSAQTQVPNTFEAGQPARAGDVNANFDALEAAIDQNAAAIQNIPAGPEGPQGPEGPPGPSGCSATQQDSNVIITCADGSSGVLASAGTMVILPEGGVSGEPPITVPTGEFVVVDATDVVLALSFAATAGETEWVIWIDVLGVRPEFVVRNNHVTQQVEFLSRYRGRIYYLSTDCSGPFFIDRRGLTVQVDGQFYLGDMNVAGNILSYSYRPQTRTIDPVSGLDYWDFGECIVGESAVGSVFLYEFTLPSEWTNAVYPARHTLLP